MASLQQLMADSGRGRAQVAYRLGRLTVERE
jgi:hypothetical protein